jgi:hypothetical protein
MGKLVFGGLLRAMALVLATVGALLVLGSTVVIIEPGQVGVRHAFGAVNSMVLMVPTEGGLPLLDIAALRKNLKER